MERERERERMSLLESVFIIYCKNKINQRPKLMFDLLQIVNKIL